MTMTKVLIVEDDLVYQAKLKDIINKQQGMEVVDAIDDAAEAPELCRELKPDLVFMDVITNLSSDRSNISDGITYSGIIHDEFPNIKIIVLTGCAAITFEDDAKAAGATLVVYKECTTEDDLKRIIHAIIKGKPIPPQRHPSRGPYEDFTPRELTIVRLVIWDIPTGEIKEMLDVSENTINSDRASLYKKSGLGTGGKEDRGSVPHVAIDMVRKGLINPYDSIDRILKYYDSKTKKKPKRKKRTNYDTI